MTMSTHCSMPFVHHPETDQRANIECMSFCPCPFIASPLRQNVSLSNLFNTFPRTSSLRLSVYQRILALADSNENLDVLDLPASDVEKWLSEWEVSEAVKASFLKSITDAYTKAAQPYVICYLARHSPSH